MDIKDLYFKELLSNQDLEIVGGLGATASGEIIEAPLVTPKAPKLTSNDKIVLTIGLTDPQEYDEYAGHCGWVRPGKKRECPDDNTVEY